MDNNFQIKFKSEKDIAREKFEEYLDMCVCDNSFIDCNDKIYNAFFVDRSICTANDPTTCPNYKPLTDW